MFSLLISAYPFVSVLNPMTYAAKILCMLLLSNLVAFSFYTVRRRSAKSAMISPEAVPETES